MASDSGGILARFQKKRHDREIVSKFKAALRKAFDQYKADVQHNPDTQQRIDEACSKCLKEVVFDGVTIIFPVPRDFSRDRLLPVLQAEFGISLEKNAFNGTYRETTIDPPSFVHHLRVDLDYFRAVKAEADKGR